jgi:alginate O-acetyltransferase complex protein AlgI
VYVFLMLGSVVVNYLAGRIIDSQESHRKAALAVGIAVNLLILGTFKYAGFFAQTLCDAGLTVPIPKISLPIGISFYTFQSISYLVDIYRREAPVQRRFVNLLLYISMFPQLIAGPIVRYEIVALEIKDRRVTPYDFVEGSYRFLIGLGKKVILANQLSEISDQFLANNLDNLSTTGAWVGIAAFTLQIFFDFSGYSDMAIGLGRCMGFHFAENFTHPYCCRTITEFWRRWHISLGSFFRDYVYIPMGGNRRHQALNIFVVWFLTGMWHGASWNFIIWGVYFGIIVTLEKYTLLKIKRFIPSVLLHCYSMLLVIIGWGIFYFDDFGKMTRFFEIGFGQAATLHDFTVESALLDNFWLWVVGIIFCLPVYDTVARLFHRVFRRQTTLKKNLVLLTRLSVSAVLLLVSVALLVGATNNAFIYTRF